MGKPHRVPSGSLVTLKMTYCPIIAGQTDSRPMPMVTNIVVLESNRVCSLFVPALTNKLANYLMVERISMS